jgi:hypothetical protein
MNQDIFCCEQMSYAVNAPEVPVIYIPKFREFGIQILDGGSGFLEIIFCPWCGQKLPGSLRAAWFEKLEELGIDPIEANIPPEFTDARWYRGL